MAKRYFSPATRCVPNRLMPTPDPITGPSMSEMVGLEKHSCSQLSAYSSLNARRAQLAVLAAPAHHLAHVAAGGECLLARRLDDDAIGLRLARKPRERLGELGPHRRGQRIERARTVERDDARASRAPRSARPPAGLLRGTIRRHLRSSCIALHNFVPARLDCMPQRIINRTDLDLYTEPDCDETCTADSPHCRPKAPVPPHFPEGGDATMLRFGLGLALALGALSGVGQRADQPRPSSPPVNAKPEKAQRSRGKDRTVGDGATADGCPAARTQDGQGLPDPAPA